MNKYVIMFFGEEIFFDLSFSDMRTTSNKTCRLAIKIPSQLSHARDLASNCTLAARSFQMMSTLPVYGFYPGDAPLGIHPGTLLCDVLAFQGKKPFE